MGRGAEGKSNEPWNPDTQSTFLYLGSLPWWWDLDTFQDREEHKYDESMLIEHLLCMGYQAAALYTHKGIFD